MKLSYVLLVFLLACGESDEGSQIQGTAPATEQVYKQKPGIVSQGPIVKHVQDGASCLFDCQPLESARLNFGQDLPISIQDCKVRDFEVAAAAANQVIYMLADCLEGYQVYSLPINEGGDTLATPTAISSSCYQNFRDVKSFSLSIHGSSIAVAYSCALSSRDAAVWLYQPATGSVKIETYTASSYQEDFDLWLSYNPHSASYAVVSKRGLLRVSPEGLPLGGRVGLSLGSKPIVQIASLGDSWVVLSRDSYLGYSSKTYCSKILNNGQLACDKKEINAPTIRLMDDKRAFQGYYSYPEAKWGMSSFNLESCSVGPLQVAGKENLSSYELRLVQPLKDNLWFALGVSDDYQGKTLTMQIFENHLAGKVHASLPIANSAPQKVTALRSASAVSVFYLDEAGQIHLRKAGL